MAVKMQKRGIALSLAPMLDRSVYENIVMVPFDGKTINQAYRFYDFRI